MELTQNEIYPYGYDNGKYGAEAKYSLQEKTLILNLYGSNHWRDWVDNFMVSRMKTVNGQLKAHRAWYYYAFRLYHFLKREIFPNNEITNIIIVGHSMGGAVGAILQQLLITGMIYDAGAAAYSCCVFSIKWRFLS